MEITEEMLLPGTTFIQGGSTRRIIEVKDRAVCYKCKHHETDMWHIYNICVKAFLSNRNFNTWEEEEKCN